MHRQQGSAHSQPTPRVGNMYEHRRAVAADPIGPGRSRSGTEQNEHGTSVSTPSNTQSLHRTSSQPAIARSQLGRPPKRLRKNTIQTPAYTDIVAEPDGQPDTETVHLSDGSSDEYQNSAGSDEAESDPQLDPEDIDIVDSTSSRRTDGSQAANRDRNSRTTTVRISTGSASLTANPAPRTPAAHGRIYHGRVYSPPTLPSSSGPSFSSPLHSRSVPTSDIRSSSPASGPSTPRHGNALGINSRRNLVAGAERAILELAKSLIVEYTIFEDPLPNVVTLTAQVMKVWDAAVERGSESGYIKPSEQSINVVSRLGWA